VQDLSEFLHFSLQYFPGDGKRPARIGLAKTFPEIARSERFSGDAFSEGGNFLTRSDDFQSEWSHIFVGPRGDFSLVLVDSSNLLQFSYYNLDSCTESTGSCWAKPD
jgi:hypothetical protein